MVARQLGEAPESLAAAGLAPGVPLAVESLLRGRYRPIHVRRPALRDPGDDPPVDGAHDVEGLPVQGGDALSVHEHPHLRGGSATDFLLLGGHWSTSLRGWRWHAADDTQVSRAAGASRGGRAARIVAMDPEAARTESADPGGRVRPGRAPLLPSMAITGTHVRIWLVIIAGS